FYTLYQLEAAEYVTKLRKPSFWLVLAQATGIFILITFIVFFVANYQFIKSQLLDWNNEKKSQIAYIEDKDKDGIPGWWEEKFGFSDRDPLDVKSDPDNDKVNNLLEFEYQIDPKDPDSDRDGYFDGEEIADGFNPAGVGKIDQDSDGIPDWWEEKFALDKSDSSDAQLDFDHDGLDNLDEYTYRSHPEKPDSDGDGVADGQEVKLGLNPAGEGSLAENPMNLVDDDSDQDRLSLYYENLFGLNPNNPDTDGDGFDDKSELQKGYDPSGEGMILATLSIPSINVTAPIIFSQSDDQDQINNELENGVIHYPGTPFFGMRGSVYLTGHSSYYAWSRSPYKEILKNLGNLQTGEKIIISAKLSNGKQIEFVYTAKSSEVVMPDNPELFRQYEGRELTLVTCWPVGTDWKRMMVKAELSYPLPNKNQ
ncbi:MAG: sortase, partial [Candidatus Moranbacteria bacterium]|nr:sortase [Candidatus Moranbacteria bacterium]